MKLSMKFGLVVFLLLALALGAGIWLFVQAQQELLRMQERASEEQDKTMEQEARRRAAIVASFGEACRDYTQKVLDPAVRKFLGNNLVLEAQSRTFVARGTFEQLQQKTGMKEYAFREASVNPL